MTSLAIDKDISADDIMSVSDLKEGKILLLTGKDGSQLVLKAEGNVTGDRIKTAAPVVRVIDPSIKMKPLKPGEVVQLQSWVTQATKVVSQIAGTASSSNAPLLPKAQTDAIAKLQTAVSTFGAASASGRSNIAKMSFVQMSTLKIALDLDQDPNNGKLLTEAESTYAKFTDALNQKGGLEAIGEVLAGDWCIGNTDRFIVPKLPNVQGRGGTGASFQKRDAQKNVIAGKYDYLKVINNVGNIAIVTENGRSRISMVDYMDPFSPFAAQARKADVSDAMNLHWGMKHLFDSMSREIIARAVADDLAFLLHPLNSGGIHSWKRNVGGMSAYKRIDAGIISGIKKIRESMNSRMKAGKLVGVGQMILEELKRAKV